MKEMLQAIDRWLMKTRDKAIYRHKGHRKTGIKTLMGEVEYSRAIYEIMDKSPERKFVYLLDEYMGFDCVGFVSSNFAEKIADKICECSYAQTAKNITDLTGQSISHQGVWNVVQRLGKKVEEQENRYVELNKDVNFHGTRETKVLMEEADVVIVRKQKRCKGKGKNFEIKLALFHEGWKQTGKNCFELAEKNVVCGIETSKDFTKRKEAMIAQIYNTDEIEMRIFNSDGGSWISTLYTKDDSVCHQLDSFHVNKAIKGVGLGKEFEFNVFNYFKSMQIDEMLAYMEAVLNSVEEDKEIVKVSELYTYLVNNKDSLVPYQNRGINLPELNEGLVYKGISGFAPDMELPNVVGNFFYVSGFCDMFSSCATGTHSYLSLNCDVKEIDDRNEIYHNKPRVSHEVCIDGTYTDLSLKDRYKGKRVGKTEMFSSIERHLKERQILFRAKH